MLLHRKNGCFSVLRDFLVKIVDYFLRGIDYFLIMGVKLRLQNGKISLEMPKNVKISRSEYAYFGSQFEALKVPLAKRPKSTDKPER